MTEIILNLFAFIILLILNYIFFTKNRVKQVETHLYSFLLVISLVAMFFGVISGICMLTTNEISSFLLPIFNKLYLIGLVSQLITFATYTFSLSHLFKKNHISIYFIIFIIICLVSTFFIVTLPVEVSSGINGKFMVTGSAIDFSLLIFVLIFVILTLFVFIDFKQLKDKRYVPIIILIAEGFAITIIQILFPEINYIINPSTTIICLIMYFTIENPDVKMLEEFRIAKDRAEKANEEKEIFLYNITQDIKNPLNDIRRASNWLNQNSKNQNVKDASYYIDKNASNVLNIVNDVLDISSMEITNIKVYDSKYDINNIVKYLEKTYIKQVSGKVDIRFNVDTNIPNTLYGDQLRLKQVLQILIENAIKYTKDGYIEFNLNSIVKKNICRLIINVEDSGVGIRPSEINDILNKESRLYENEKIDENKKNLAMAKSITSLLGGILLIDSEIGSGTKIILVLDQKIYEDKSIELNKIEKDVEKYVNNTKVLLVIEDDEYREKIVKKISRYELDVEVVELGSKCLDNIRLNKKYDLIIMDEKLSHLSSLEIITKLKEIPSFKTPVALLTDNTDNQGYIDNGFTYLLDRKLSSKEFNAIIEEIEK